LFFVNFEGLSVRSAAEIAQIRHLVAEKLLPLGHKVCAIVNYDRFSILPELLDGYSAMVQDLTDRFYSGVTRYTTSGFLRVKLGDALGRRQLAPHIYESAEEARAHLAELEQSGG
jgi:propionate CoA-transferase